MQPLQNLKLRLEPLMYEQLKGKNPRSEQDNWHGMTNNKLSTPKYLWRQLQV